VKVSITQHCIKTNDNNDDNDDAKQEKEEVVLAIDPLLSFLQLIFCLL